MVDEQKALRDKLGNCDSCNFDAIHHRDLRASNWGWAVYFLSLQE